MARASRGLHRRGIFSQLCPAEVPRRGTPQRCLAEGSPRPRRGAPQRGPRALAEVPRGNRPPSRLLWVVASQGRLAGTPRRGAGHPRRGTPQRRRAPSQRHPAERRAPSQKHPAEEPRGWPLARPDPAAPTQERPPDVGAPPRRPGCSATARGS